MSDHRSADELKADALSHERDTSIIKENAIHNAEWEQGADVTSSERLNDQNSSDELILKKLASESLPLSIVFDDTELSFNEIDLNIFESNRSLDEFKNQVGALYLGDTKIADIEYKPGPRGPSFSLKKIVKKIDLDLLKSVLVSVSFELTPFEYNILDCAILTVGSIIKTEQRPEQPLLLVSDTKVVARGELCVVDDNFACRVCDTSTKNQPIKNENRIIDSPTVAVRTILGECSYSLYDLFLLTEGSILSFDNSIYTDHKVLVGAQEYQGEIIVVDDYLAIRIVKECKIQSKKKQSVVHNKEIKKRSLLAQISHSVELVMNKRFKQLQQDLFSQQEISNKNNVTIMMNEIEMLKKLRAQIEISNCLKHEFISASADEVVKKMPVAIETQTELVYHLVHEFDDAMHIFFIMISGDSINEAAGIILSLPDMLAAKVMSGLSRNMQKKLISAISTIETISRSDLLTYIIDYDKLFQKAEIPGGTERAISILENSMGEDAALAIINTLGGEQEDRPLAYLRSCDSSLLIPFLLNEHPQTIAFVLSCIHKEKAAQYLAIFSEDLQTDIVVRIREMGCVSSHIAREVERVLKPKVVSLSQQKNKKTGGLESVVAMLKKTDRSTEKRVLEALITDEPELAQQLTQRLKGNDLPEDDL